MVKIFIFFSLFTIQLGFAQSGKPSIDDINSSGAVRISFVENEVEAKKLAQIDIENKVLVLFLQSGISSITYPNDTLFQNKYNLFYFELGCVSQEPSIIESYNLQVFKFLDGKFGKDWRKKIRKDIIGFKKYKKSN